MEIMQVVFISYYLQWMVNFPELLAQFLHHPDMVLFIYMIHAMLEVGNEVFDNIVSSHLLQEEEMPNVTEFVEPTHQILEERKLSDITSQPQYLT